MGRNRSKTTEAPTDSPEPETMEVTPSSDAGEETPEPSEGTSRRRPAKKIKKKEAVRRILEMGITSPTKIVEEVRKRYKMDITSQHVSTIKGGLSREASMEGSDSPDADSSSRSRSSRASGSASLTALDLDNLAYLADRVGGIDRLQEFLSALKRLR